MNKYAPPEEGVPSQEGHGCSYVSLYEEGQKIGGYYWPFNFLIFQIFFGNFDNLFSKIGLRDLKNRNPGSKSVWGQIFMQIRPKFNDFLAIYEFVMICSRMARCLVFVDHIFALPHIIYYNIVYYNII